MDIMELNFFVTALRAATLKLNIRHDRDGDGVVIVIITFQTTQPNQTTTPCQYYLYMRVEEWRART